MLPAPSQLAGRQAPCPGNTWHAVETAEQHAPAQRPGVHVRPKSSGVPPWELHVAVFRNEHTPAGEQHAVKHGEGEQVVP